MKRAILCTVISFSILFSMAGCKTEKKSTTEPEFLDMIFEPEIYQTVEQIKDRSDAVVIGYYTDEPAEQYFKDDGTGLEFYTSRYSLHVEKVLKGELIEGSELTFSQMGKPDSDDYETKIKKDRKYLLFLCKKDIPEEEIYDAAGMEQGIVEINDNNKMYPYGDIGIMKTLNGKDFSEIQKKICK